MSEDLPLFRNASAAPPSNALTVGQITARIKANLEGTFRNVLVQGEISNLKIASSGHVYFSLKDDSATISAVAFHWGRKKASFELKDGMEVRCEGSVSVYAARGNYQLLVDSIEPQGAGSLQLAFEQLKEKLKKEGLFDSSRKKSLPKFPRRILVVTSPQAAAFHDVRTVLRRRAPFVEVLLVPAPVQGEDAPARLIQALRVADHYRLGDVILLTRGGGSMEDLWAFNHEELARTIASLSIPVVSAVGHEIDFTIADFVADLRAPTPSAGAEMLTQHWVELRERSRQLGERLVWAFKRDLGFRRQGLQILAGQLKSPQDRLRERAQRVDDFRFALERAMALVIERRKSALERAGARLHALSPLQVLSRGYALVTGSGGQGLIRTSEEAARQERMSLRFVDGEIEVKPC
jgi:exodeoxyribonuclease VII large subunit